jgi:hypothetical protein
MILQPNLLRTRRTWVHCALYACETQVSTSVPALSGLHVQASNGTRTRLMCKPAGAHQRYRSQQPEPPLTLGQCGAEQHRDIRAANKQARRWSAQAANNTGRQCFMQGTYLVPCWSHPTSCTTRYERQNGRHKSYADVFQEQSAWLAGYCATPLQSRHISQLGIQQTHGGALAVEKAAPCLTHMLALTISRPDRGLNFTSWR